MMSKKTILVTGVAGFIGSNLCLKLFESNENVHIIGIDNMTAAPGSGRPVPAPAPLRERRCRRGAA